jgi:hypothetical protein
MFSLYSSGQAGIFGAIVKKTNVDRILQLNCNATDFYQERDFPTYLYYNPYESSKKVKFYHEGGKAVDLYDAVTHEIVARNILGETEFEIPSATARVVVVLPSNSNINKNGNTYSVEGKTIAYSYDNAKKK